MGALKLITETKEDLKSLPKDEQHRLKSFCNECEGWVYYKQIADQEKANLAAQHLDEAISLWAEAGSYYRAGAFKESTLLKVLNQGKFEEVPTHLRRWVYSGGKKVQGLVNRRENEIDLWFA